MTWRMRAMTRYAMPFVVLSLSGCAAIPEALSAAGGAMTLTKAWLEYNTEVVEVIPPDCILTKPIIMTDDQIDILLAEMPQIARKIAANNVALKECPDAGK